MTILRVSSGSRASSPEANNNRLICIWTNAVFEKNIQKIKKVYFKKYALVYGCVTSNKRQVYSVTIRKMGKKITNNPVRVFVKASRTMERKTQVKMSGIPVWDVRIKNIIYNILKNS